MTEVGGELLLLSGGLRTGGFLRASLIESIFRFWALPFFSFFLVFFGCIFIWV